MVFFLVSTDFFCDPFYTDEVSEMSVSAASSSNANSSSNEPVTTSGSTLGASENPSASDEKASVEAENVHIEGSQNGEEASSEQHVDDGDNDGSATDAGAAAPSTNGWESPRQVLLLLILIR